MQTTAGPVAVLLPNEARLPAAMLGVIAAGRPFIALDPEHPLERNLAILKQASASAVLSGGPTAVEVGRSLPATRVVDLDEAGAAPGRRPDVRLGPGDLAYILYTSGSTGVAKGVCHTHRACLYDALTIAGNVHLTCEDRLSLFYAGVIGAVRRTFSALLNGASLHIMPPAGRSAAELAAEFRARRITYMHEVPTIFRRIAGGTPAGERLDSLRVVRLSGDRSEWRDYDLFRRTCPPDAFFGVNLGATEASTYLHWFVDEGVRRPGERLPVGREMDGFRVTVVDADGEPVLDGEVGEFQVASPYVAFGYWNAPELTATAFQADPEDPASRIYRTGDMGFRRSDGLFEFVGRKDQMIKLRGHRIEPGEVEAALRACPGVVDAAAVIRRDEAGAPRAMVAYVERTAGFESLLPRHMMALISRRLPRYLMPSVIFVVEALPRLISFKIDRMEISRLDADRASRDDSRAADPLLDRVARVFETILPGARATPEDNLLSLGGDSLQAVELALELGLATGVEVPGHVMKQSQSIREVTDWIRGRQKTAAPG